MYFHTLRTHNPIAICLDTEVGYGLLSVLIARNIILEVSLHILQGESLGCVHVQFDFLNYI